MVLKNIVLRRILGPVTVTPETNGRIQWTTLIARWSVSEIEGRDRLIGKNAGEDSGRPRTAIAVQSAIEGVMIMKLKRSLPKIKCSEQIQGT